MYNPPYVHIDKSYYINVTINMEVLAMGKSFTNIALKTAEEITKRSVNIGCTWLLYQPKISKKTRDKFKKCYKSN